MATPQLVDEYGNPLRQANNPKLEIARLRGELAQWQARARTQTRVEARYDVSSPDEHSERHWANADYLSPDAANDHYVRRRMRSRSRYEVIENNSYLKGMALSMCNDFVGSGPRIRIDDTSYTEPQRRQIQERFAHWAMCVKLRQKIWRLRMARFVDGEGFALQFVNRKIMDAVKLDYWLFEADQCGYGYSGDMVAREGGWRYIDGVRFSRYQQVDAYYILNSHPGGRYLSWSEDFEKYGEWVPEEFVLHWFRQERSWLRGIPETVPALPLCAILRRYTLAVLHSAETAADFAGVLQTTAPPFEQNWANPSGSTDDYEAFDTFPIEKNMFTTVPYGYQLAQLRAEQPTTVYDKFVEAVLKEISRCLLIPFNIASGFSGGYNFASGTLDRQMYQGAISRDREHFEDNCLDKMFASWWSEAVRTDGYFDGLDRASTDITSQLLEVIPPPRHSWTWDDIQEHADPVKVAQSTKIWHDMGAVTDEDIQQKRLNRGIEDHYAALGRQNEARRELGMPIPGIPAQAVLNAGTGDMDPGRGGAEEPEDADAETEEA